jgi:hypothetical protein
MLKMKGAGRSRTDDGGFASFHLTTVAPDEYRPDQPRARTKARTDPPPDLAELGELWPHLPAAVRRGILAQARATAEDAAP